MGNKLVQVKEEKNKRSRERKRRLFATGFWILTVAFLLVWGNIIGTSIKIQRQMEQMVLGTDYFIEEVTIRKKDTYSGTNGGDSNTNYLFYYGDSWEEKMEVPREVYIEHEVGDKIPAYTENHLFYSYTKEGILPGFRENEIMKCAGVVLGAGICLMLLYNVLDRKTQ